MISTKRNINLKNIHNGRAYIHIRLPLVLHLSISLRSWGWQSIFKQIIDILSNALSDAHECPFDHVTTIKIFAIQNIASKQIFAQWQAILSVFDFDIEFIEGT